MLKSSLVVVEFLFLVASEIVVLKEKSMLFDMHGIITYHSLVFVLVCNVP